MKAQHSNKNILFGISFCIVIGVTAMAFQDSSKISKDHKPAHLDSVPKTNQHDIEFNLKDLDETIKKSFEMAEKSMKQIDWAKMTKEIEQSMKQIDMAKIQMDIAKSMKDIDWNKMKLEIDQSMKEIEFNKLKVDMEKMKTELKESFKDFNNDEWKKSMEELKKTNFDDVKKTMDKVKSEMELHKDQFKLDMEKLKLDMSKLKEEMGEVKIMVDEMENDGLLNKKESNTIEFKNKELFINGKKQSQEMTEKYKKYFKGDNFKFSFNWD